MRIEFDPAKDASNLEKHGLSLALAAGLDWDVSLVWIDEQYEYGELRMIALAPDTGILYYVALGDRGEKRSTTSLRKPNRREGKHYGQRF